MILVSSLSLAIGFLLLLTSKSDVVVVHQTVNGIDLATNVEVTGSSVQVLDGRVGLVVGTENLDGLLLLVGLVDVVNGDDGQVAVVSEVTEGDAGTSLCLDFVNGLLEDIEADRHGKEVAVDETVGVNDTLVVLLVHEALKRGEASIEDQLEITKLTLIEDNGGQLLGLFDELLATRGITSNKILEDTT